MWKLSKLNIYVSKFSKYLSESSFGCLFYTIRLGQKERKKEYIQFKQGKNS